MNFKLFYIIIFFISFNGYAQHTERFKNLVKDLKPSSTEKVDIKYGNEVQKKTGTLHVYNHGGYTYSFYTGKVLDYYRKGTLVYEYIYDDYGISLSSKWFDSFDNVLRESKTLTIDTKAKNIEEFLNERNHLLITIHQKIYRFDTEKGEFYVKKEGQKLNGEKIGVWKTYFENGSLKKEKNYTR
jgi:hypothetical protein